ncbi:hypothetical protein M413DRAFT_29664 [Hebeloma cylindrosporum]|uniref:Uncharacterized protein n=1 Tax=Hebeloma cylindrosporum TaxID=76867 RepID=A0A0C3BR43_HEBCY|nr:hypothetical protein M413DRAFT_29664 [Hebeloma cylindrosporum h7]
MSALDARSNIQTAIDPLPLSEEPFIHSEDDSSDSVDDEELQTFSIIVSPRKYVDEEDIKCRARQLVQEAWSMNFVWDITEIRNVDPESEALSEGMEEPPALMECPNWEDEVDFEILDREGGEMLEYDDDSNHCRKTNAESARIEPRQAMPIICSFRELISKLDLS